MLGPGPRSRVLFILFYVLLVYVLKSYFCSVIVLPALFRPKGFPEANQRKHVVLHFIFLFF